MAGGTFFPVRYLQAARQLVTNAKNTEGNYSASMQLCKYSATIRTAATEMDIVVYQELRTNFKA